ncbi:MAG: alpha/beta hydrolase [Actinomycetota bacterium]|nr:alpha/beta hydrolase [Actinomycetota bacterium]
MKIPEAKWAGIHVAFLFAILLGLSSSCSADTSDAPSKVGLNNPSTGIEVSEEFKREENSVLKENNGKDDHMEVTKIESIRDLNERSNLSLQLAGTDIREVAIDISDFSFDALIAGPPSGEPIMLLHGFPNTNYQWREQIVALAEAGFFVVAPNQRGYSSGARPKGIESYTSEKLVEDVRRIADALLWESFHLAGHDWGAFIAWEFAGKYPDRLRTLIPISVPHPEAFAIALADPNGIQSEMSSYAEFFQQAESTSAFLTDNASLLKSIYESAGLSIEEMEPYLKVLGKPEALDAALNWYRANSFSLPLDQATNRRSDTPDIETPTMYIWSTEDTALGRQGAELTSSFVSGEYRYEVFEGVNHWITEIAAKQLNSVMLDFLSEKVKRVE